MNAYIYDKTDKFFLSNLISNGNFFFEHSD